MINFTIGITNCNRYYYSKALIKSLSFFKDKSYNEGIKTRIIFVDNGSTESGREEFENSEYVDQYVYREERNPSKDEWLGKNEILRNIDDDVDVLCFLQDDCQLISVDSLIACVKDFITFDPLLHMHVFGVRRITNRNNLKYVRRTSEKTGFHYWENFNIHLNTTGIYKKSLFDEIGEYPIEIDEKTFDGFTAAEDLMSKKAVEEGSLNYVLSPQIPPFVSIWNDPRGLQALVRDDFRYGFYNPPDKETSLYYEMIKKEDALKMNKEKRPMSFVDIAYPIGWELPLTEDGEQKKYDKRLIRFEGPVSTFDGKEVVNEIV